MSSPQQTTSVFLSSLRKSGLVQPDQLMRAMAELRRSTGKNAPDDQALTKKLVDDGFLTDWQAQRLADGRHKGFFLGKHKLLRLLGSGGMSSVYLAEHTLMRRQVAIKVLPLAKVNESSYLQRFFLEARVIASLDHTNIVQAYNVDNEGSVYYLVMQYVDGEDLSRMVKKNGPMDVFLAAGYIKQAADGLAHAHSRGMVHRDVKPANLLVDRQNTVKILDMGVARLTGRDERSLTLEHNESVLGTTDYLAPEQAVDSHTADHRADLYSLGCTLYFLLTGHPPFHEGTLAERLMKHQKETPPPIEKERPDCPADLIEICTRMMAKKPDQRYQSATEASEALQYWLHNHAPTVDAPAETRGSSGRLPTVLLPSSSSGGSGRSSGGSGVAVEKPTKSGSGTASKSLSPITRPAAPAPATDEPSGEYLEAQIIDDAPAAEDGLAGFLRNLDQDAQTTPRASGPGYGQYSTYPQHNYHRPATAPIWLWVVVGALALAVLVVGALVLQRVI